MIFIIIIAIAVGLLILWLSAGNKASGVSDQPSGQDSTDFTSGVTIRKITNLESVGNYHSVSSRSGLSKLYEEYEERDRDKDSDVEVPAKKKTTKEKEAVVDEAVLIQKSGIDDVIKKFAKMENLEEDSIRADKARAAEKRREQEGFDSDYIE